MFPHIQESHSYTSAWFLTRVELITWTKSNIVDTKENPNWNNKSNGKITI